MFLIPLQTDNKQILRRWAPQNDIATSPQGDGRQAHPQPNFQRSRRVRRVRSIFNKDSLLGVLRASAVNIRTLFDCAPEFCKPRKFSSVVVGQKSQGNFAHPFSFSIVA